MHDWQEHWQEQEFWHGSGGAFSNQQASKLRRPEPPAPTSLEDAYTARISVVCPTTDSRHEFHEQLWSVFDAQAWPDKELVIVETYTQRPSPFFTQKKKEDERLIYVSYKVQPDKDWSIGLKRNMCTFLSSGTFLANFDDDDLYAPNYLNVMIESMLEQKSEAITLSTYYVFDVRSGTFGWCDQRYASESTRYGYGFSYVFLRGAALYHPYPDQNMGEDYGFFRVLKNRQRLTVFGGQRQVALHVDETGICCHTLHPKATSNTYAKRKVPPEEVESLDIGDLEDLLSSYVNRFPQTQGMSNFIRTAATQREQKVTIHSTIRDFEFSVKMGTRLEEVLELLHPEMQCGGAPAQVHLHMSCPPCLEQAESGLQMAELPQLPDEPDEPDGAEHEDGSSSPARSKEDRIREQALEGAPSLSSTLRIGPRRSQFWATLPVERHEEPDLDVVVRDIRNQEVSVTVRAHSIQRLSDVRRSIIRQHGSQSIAARKLARDIRLAQRHMRAGEDKPEKGAYFEACDLSKWLLDRREFYAAGLQHYLDQVSFEQGTLPVVRFHVAGVDDGFLLLEVPLPVCVRNLRTVLNGRLPKNAHIFPGCLKQVSGPNTPDALEEDVRLPSVVTADSYDGNMVETIFSTRDMAIQAQQRCIEMLEKDETQQLFDKLEAESKDSNKYRLKMHDALYQSVYVPLLESYGLPLSRKGVMQLSTSIQAHFTPMDYEMTTYWLQVEQLMRNRNGVKAAEAAVARIHAIWAQAEMGPAPGPA